MRQMLILLLASGFWGGAIAQGASLPERLQTMDSDGDGRISRQEWRGPDKRFEQWDANGDGFVTASEIQAWNAQKRNEENSARVEAGAPVLAAGMGNLIEHGPIRGPHRRAIMFPGASKEELRAAGMDESGLVVLFPPDSRCRAIDHVFGEQWKGPADTLHSGADIPAPFDEAVIAMAEGVVVLKSDGMDSGRKSRGTQLVLQHAPADTGLPFWVYTLYSHFNKMPEWEPGQRVRMGTVLGPNGRSGVPGAKREPHLHLTVLISDSPRFAISNGVVVPEFGRFIDPPALFLGRLPMDTADVKKLTGDQRKVQVSVMYEDGQVLPEASKLIWPFRCARR